MGAWPGRAWAHGLRITLMLFFLYETFTDAAAAANNLGWQSLRGCMAREGVGARPKNYL